MPCRTPLATMRTGVSCISANATATCTDQGFNKWPLAPLFGCIQFLRRNSGAKPDWKTAAYRCQSDRA